jgi:hypothetical protein
MKPTAPLQSNFIVFAMTPCRGFRIRTEGNQNLIEAAQQSGSPKILAQSVAWRLPDGPDALAVAELERSVLAEGGVVLRYGQFYGPGT